MLLTHYHWDHIQGLPTFMPLFDASNTFVFRGPHHDVTVRQALTEAMRPPWWPVDFDEVAASVRFEDTTGSSRVGPVEVVAVQGSHPQGVVAYRLSGEEHAIVVATDHEGGDPGVDASIVGMARRAHVLIHDAQYTPEELRSSRKGWGHSSYESAVRTAVDAEVGRLVLTSHDPDRTDDQVDRMRGMARASFPHTDAAFEGMTLIL
jgi:phosphoribosyl 1,2-cyclic phosphodiesterase